MAIPRSSWYDHESMFANVPRNGVLFGPTGMHAEKSDLAQSHVMPPVERGLTRKSW